MSLTIIFLALILLLIVINVLMIEWPSIRSMYFNNKIHGARGFPIIGSMHVLWKMRGPGIMDYIEKYRSWYPRLSNFYVAGITSILINEPQDVQMILSGVNHIKKGVEYSFISPWLNEGLLTSFSTKWHMRRKLLTPTFHFRILEDSLSSMNKSVNKLVEKLTEVTGKPIKIEKYVTKCALNIIAESAMGINLKAQGEAGKSYVKSVKKTGELIILRIINGFQFKDWIYKLSDKGKSFYKQIDILHEFTDKVIRERKAYNKDTEFEVEDGSGRKVRRAFLDCLLETQRKEKGLLTDLDIREEVDTFMFEGHDTTSSAICFALWLLGHHPEEQEKVYEELEEIFSNEEQDVSMSDTHKMNYLEKVIKETLRLYPSVPYLSRRLTQDCILDDGTVLPTSTNCVILPYFLHRIPKYFPDPEKFDPERFSEENFVGRHPFVYIPFSAGPRNCIGQKFAMLEMKLTLAKILLKLKVKAITKREEFKILPYLIIRSTVPLEVIFTSRKKVK